MSNPWDNNATERHQQLLDGRDFSFNSVLLPTFKRLLYATPKAKSRLVLDIGCGSGILTHFLSKRVNRIIGIDPSRKSIELANLHKKGAKNLDFFCSSRENFHHARKFDIIIS